MRKIKEIGTMAGVEPTPHTLRHTAATEMLKGIKFYHIVKPELLVDKSKFSPSSLIMNYLSKFLSFLTSMKKS